MPESKQRVRLRVRRNRAKEARARATQAAQKRAEEKKISPAAYTRRRVLGWSLVVLAAVVFVQHLVSHMGAFSLISPGVDDIVAGYPLAALLAVAGAIALSR